MPAKTVMVTGGTGFIGSNLCHELVAKGYNVIALDDLSLNNGGNISDLVDNRLFRFVKGSVLDDRLLSEELKGVHAVFHEAAIPSVQRSIENPRRTNEVNVTGTLEVLIAAKNAGIKKVILASSSSVYGDTPTLPKREDMMLNPKSVYAASKLTCEQYSIVFNRIHGMSNVCLRYFNVYGPRQDPKSEYAAVVPRFISQALNDLPLTVHGTGMQTRDFTCVKDVAQANLLSLAPEASGIFNIGSGERISIFDLAGLISRILGKEIEMVHLDARAGDVIDSLADINKAAGKLGYGPQYRIEDGLRESIQWFRKGK
jgi:UDP-glucose 4-epimerase